MNLIKSLALAVLFLPLCAAAQDINNQLTYFVGGSIKQTTLKEAADYKLPLSDLVAAPYIQLIYKNHDYAVTSYTVSIMSKRLAKVVGQLKLQQGSLVQSAAMMDYTLAAGDRIFIEDVDAFCGKCTEEKNITPAGLAILVE